MSNVVPFTHKKLEDKEEIVWVCDCGNGSFYIHGDGEIECAACGTFHHDEPKTLLRNRFYKETDHD